MLGGDFESPDFHKKLSSLEIELNKPTVWKNSSKASTFLKEYNKLKEQLTLFNSLLSNYHYITEVYALSKNDNDSQLLAECVVNLTEIYNTSSDLENLILLGREDDAKSCFLEVHAGAGGTEANDWASMLLAMYTKWATKHNFKVEIIDSSSGEEVGIKSAILKINGKYSYGLLKTEIGVHRLVRISPFDANKKRHTSFVAVSVYKDMGETTNINILESDLKIDTFRASGAGGQHVNKTDSAVRITHIPTGIVVQSQCDRSQGKNKSLALKLLQAKLNKLQEDKAAASKKEEYSNKEDIGWGYRVRSYILHPYRLVKDLRTNIEHPHPTQVLNGEIDDFIKGMLIKDSLKEYD